MIAVDWGTSNLRLYRLDGQGMPCQRRRNDIGALAGKGRFGEVLAQQIAGWDDELILMCGMVGGRGGWHETPYLECPAGNRELAMGLQPIVAPELEGRRLFIVPGLRDSASGTDPDVMRGEETQLAALLDVLPGGNHLACLPGTHSKWVLVRDGRVQRISTAMTGEVYALLRQHGILAQLMPSGEERFDAYAFGKGLRRSGDDGGLLHHLFGVRTAGLFGQFDPTTLPSYLSGILIGHEIRASGLFSLSPRLAQVHLVGNERLLAAYAHALTTFGVGVQRHPEDLAAHGLHVLWSHRAGEEHAR